MEVTTNQNIRIYKRICINGWSSSRHNHYLKTPWWNSSVTQQCWKKCCHKYSQPTGYQHIQDKNWSHRMIFSYWTHHQPRDISEDGCRIGRWSNYSIKNGVDELSLNRVVRSVIANPSVARSRTEVRQVRWRVQGLVTIPQFLPEPWAQCRSKTRQIKHPIKMLGPTSNTWIVWS
jgi:hypothetical protein